MIEKRITEHAGCKVETREGGGRILTGYGAVFYRADDPGTEYQLWRDLVERIAPGAFDRVLSEKQDARGLYNHDVNFLLGRVGAGTMRLSVDQRGLRYEIDLPDTSQANDLAVSVARGDIDGSSFGFIVKKESYQINKETEMDVRTIEDVDLFDVGPVVFPAYTATSAGVRSAFYRGLNDQGAAETELRVAYERAKSNHQATIEARNKILAYRMKNT